MPTIEDSYDGALRQLRALGHEPPLHVPPPPIGRRLPPVGRPKVDEARAQLEGRVRDLEDLAQLACDENEQLKAQLEEERAENERLHRRITTLEGIIANPREVLGLPELPFDEECPPTPRGNAGGTILAIGFVAAMLGGGLLVRGQVRDLRTAMAIAATVQDLRGRAADAWARASGAHPRYGRALLDGAPVAGPPTDPVTTPTAAPAAAAPPKSDAVVSSAEATAESPKPAPKEHRHHHRRAKSPAPSEPHESPEL